MRWGPEPLGEGRTRFALWSPGRKTLTLEIDSTATVDDRHPGMVQTLELHQEADGWLTTEAIAPPGTRYRYVLDGQRIPDPASRLQAEDAHGWSVVPDPESYAWQTTDWRGRPWTETVLHEVHVGALGGFAGVAERLEGWAAIGFTAIELMPVATFGGTRGWGYDGVLPYAPHPTYGTADDLKALVDRAHGLGLSIFVDVVYNHFGPDGNYLPALSPAFFRQDAHTPWGDAIDFAAEPVRRFFIDNALMWLTDYRIDGLRFDAVHAIGEPAFLDAMAAEVRAALPGRHVHLVLENEENDAGRLSAFDAQWNDDWHNVLHVLLTGEHHAYYADFAEQPAERLARALGEGFVYQGEPSPNHDGAPRGTPSAHLPPTRFVSFLQNHDQVGNRAMGERLTSLVAPDRLRAATALLLLGPQVPLTFMGDETGSRSPFLFFTDFHDELANAVREGRRGEFAKFPDFADPDRRARIPDPNAFETFEASQPVPGPDAAEWGDLFRTLLALRRERIAPFLDHTEAAGAEAIGPAAVLAQWRLGPERLTIALNLGDTPVPLDPPGEPLLAEIGRPLDAAGLPPATCLAWLG